MRIKAVGGGIHNDLLWVRCVGVALARAWVV